MNVKINKTVILVGLMGVGKTSIGRRLAAKLDLPFVDIDSEIESQEGCTISEVFKNKGEAAFRKIEKDTIAYFLNESPHVMAVGGGAFIDTKTRELIRKMALSIWLKADLDVLVDRVSRRNTRPLLEGGDKKEIMKKLMDERYPIYAEADIVVESDEGPHQSVVEAIIEKLNKYNGK